MCYKGNKGCSTFCSCLLLLIMLIIFGSVYYTWKSICKAVDLMIFEVKGQYSYFIRQHSHQEEEVAHLFSAYPGTSALITFLLLVLVIYLLKKCFVCCFCAASSDDYRRGRQVARKGRCCRKTVVHSYAYV